MALRTGLAGSVGWAEEVYAADVQTLTTTGAPTGGTLPLTWGGQSTTVAYNATAAAVSAALNALASITGAGGVACAGGALPTGVTITFNQTGLRAMIATGSSGLTGGATPTGVIAHTTPGTGYGSGATPTRFPIGITPSDAFKLNIQQVESQALISGNIVRRTGQWALNRKGVAGSQGFEFRAITFAMLLKHMLGVTPVITTPTNGVLTRLFTYAGPQPLSGLANRSLCWQRGIPTNQGIVNPRTAVGVKIDGWQLSAAVDALLTGQVTLDGQDENNTTALASVSYATEPATQPGSALFWTGGNVSIGGATVPVKKFDLTMTRNLDTARYELANTNLKLEPVEQAYSDLKMSIDVEYQDETLWNLWTTGALATVTANFQGALIETVASPGPYYYSLNLTMQNCRLDGDDPALSTLGVIPLTIPLDVLWDGTTQPIQASLYTTDTAI